MRFEARVRDEPGQLWGVWDAEDEEWHETLLGTTEEGDARRSAEMLNAMQVQYGLAICGPPRVYWRHPAMLALAFGAFGGISMSSDNAGIVGTAVVGMLMLIPGWWKLVQMRSWIPHAHVMPIENDHDDQEETQ